MLRSTSLLDAAIAFFYSGIFWMMVWFVIENWRTPRAERKRLMPFALLLMVCAAYLMLGVVAHQTTVPWLATPISAAQLSGQR